MAQSKIKAKEISSISYDGVTKELKIFNKKNLLIFVSNVDEQIFDITASKFLDHLEKEKKKA